MNIGRDHMTAATVVRSCHVRVWELSAEGCLLESREPMPVGLVGALELVFDGEPRVEWFRICRVHAHEGRRGSCLVAAAFLRLQTAGPSSLRAAVRRLSPLGPVSEMPPASGRSSGDTGNSPRDRRVHLQRSTVSASGCAQSGDSASASELATPLLKRRSRARSWCVGRDKE